MIKLKSKQPKEARVEPSLADRIKEVCAEAEAYVESRVQEIKTSPEGELLPISWLRLNIRATTFAGSCHCKAALALLADKDKINGG